MDGNLKFNTFILEDKQNIMISKNKIKLIKSLSSKKYRQKYGLFLVEGDKNVLETLNSDYQVNELYASDNFLESNEKITRNAVKITRMTTFEIKKASLLVHPQHALAICSKPFSESKTPELKELTLYLDGIQDPGNMGTIIRICDWFGIGELICSPDTADVYNPKVIQASMGSFCRVKIFYMSFNKISGLARELNIPVFGTFIKGLNIYEEILPSKALVVLGNEGSGISKEVSQMIEHKIKIPSFSKKEKSAESLNVAIAAGIICSEFKRQTYSK